MDASYGGATDKNALAALNVIANPTLTIAGQEVDAGRESHEGRGHGGQGRRLRGSGEQGDMDGPGGGE